MSTTTERWPHKIEDSAFEYDLAEMLKKHRLRRGIEQAEVARRMKISPAAISQYESHINCPDRLSKWQAWHRAVGLRFIVEIRDAAGVTIPFGLADKTDEGPLPQEINKTPIDPKITKPSRCQFCGRFV